MNETVTWAMETMQIINAMTPEITGKAFDPEWFLLRQRLEEIGTERDSLREDVAKLRRMLAMAYSGPVNLYGDDGELTDTVEQPWIDYVRDSVDTIAKSMQQRGENKVAASQFLQGQAKQ